MLSWSHKGTQGLPQVTYYSQRRGNGRRYLQILLLILATYFLWLVLWQWGYIASYDRLKSFSLPSISSSCPQDMSCERMAASVNARDLIRRRSYARLKNTEEGKIPHIIHQSWGKKPLTPLAKKLSETWRKNHPNWKWVNWTDEDNRMLVKQLYPWFLEAYDAFDHNIKRADAARNLYMHAFGGMYVDYDLESVKSIEPLLEEGTKTDSLSTPSSSSGIVSDKYAFFGSMGTDPKFSNSIPNDWMASSAGHAFFLLPLINVMQIGVNASNSVRPETVTGPLALRERINSFKQNYPWRENELFSHVKTRLGMNISKDNLHLTVFNASTIHPLNWLQKGDPSLKYCFGQNILFNPAMCKEQIKPLQSNTYAIAYWTHTWE